MEESPERARFRAIRRKFEALMDLSLEQQVAALDQLTDPSMHEELRRLLLADADEADLDRLALLAQRARAPERVGPYRVLRELGRGGMAVVYEAEEQSPRRRVALKVPHAHLRSNTGQRLTRGEAQSMADAQHPGIPSVYGLFEWEGAPVVAMELVEGLRITEHVQVLPLDERLELLARTCDAVACAHRRGVVHRDLKPSNILVTQDGQPKVLDFGIAAHAEFRPPPGSGTRRYMAPEQAAGRETTPAVDVYALGVLSLEVILGVDADHPDSNSPPEQLLAASRLRGDLRAILTRALAPQPQDRYADAGLLGEELRRSKQKLPVVAEGSGPLVWLRAALRRRPVLGGALGLVLVLVLLLLVQRDRAHQAFFTLLGSRRLAALQADPRGPEDPEVKAALDELLADPQVLVTPVAAQAYLWRAQHEPDQARLASLAAAYVFSPPAQTPQTQDALAQALIAAEDWSSAAALGPMHDPRLRSDVALARWDLDSDELLPETRRWLGALALAQEVDPEVRAVELLTPERRLELGPGALRLVEQGQVTRSWPLPGPGKQLRVSEGRVLVTGQGPWLASGALDSAELNFTPVTPQVPDLLIPPSDSGCTAVYAQDRDPMGVFVLREGQTSPLDEEVHAQGLAARALRILDLDGDGQDELVLGAAGRGGRELRVLGAPWQKPSIKARIRLGVYAMTSLKDGTLWALAGPVDAEPGMSPLRRALVPLRWSQGDLSLGEPIPLEHETVEVMAVDLNGDGAEELLVSGQDRVGVIDPQGQAPQAWIPDLAVLGVGQADSDPAAELWVRSGDRAFLLGAGGQPLARPAPPLTPEPAPLPELSGPLGSALERVGSLLRLGRSDLALGPLQRLNAVLPGDSPVRLWALETLAQIPGVPGPAVVDLAWSALEQGQQDPVAQQAALGILRRAHAYDVSPRRLTLLEPGLLRAEALDLAQPLPEVAQLGAMGLARRDALSARMELDLPARSGLALALPLDWEEVLCVDLDLNLLELDWAAGFVLQLSQEQPLAQGQLWRVGSGPRELHLLNLSDVGHGASTRLNFALGPHQVSMCLSQEPALFSLRLDEEQRMVYPLTGPLHPGAVRLELLTLDTPGYSPQRKARLQLTALTLRGATVAAGPPGDALPRRLAEGDLEALLQLRETGSAYERALVDEALDAVGPASITGLNSAERAALLRRNMTVWGPLLRSLGDSSFLQDWMAAWDVPLHYQDPWALVAMLSPSLADLPVDSPEGARLGLARAKALMGAGRVAAAQSLLRSLLPSSAEAWLTLTRLELRRGRPDSAREALQGWITRAPSRSFAVDTVTDDPELAAVLPELQPAAAWRE